MIFLKYYVFLYIPLTAVFFIQIVIKITNNSVEKMGQIYYNYLKNKGGGKIEKSH